MIINYNPNELKETDIEEYEEKVRLLIKNDQDEILVANYGGAYLLPGGKIDDNELVIEALIREIKEEVGVDVKENDITSIVMFKYYQKAFPKRNGKVLDRKITTHYYKANMNIDLNMHERNLTEKEVKDNFKLEWIKEKDLKDVIKNNPSIKENPRVGYMNTELLKVLDVYTGEYEKEYRIKENQVKIEGTTEFGNNLASTSDDYIYFLYFQRMNEIQKFRDSSNVDMHMHSVYSDGDLTPNELIKMAYKNNIGTISITDHDTLKGLKKIVTGYRHEEADYVKVIPGIELSAKTDRGRMHILGYDFDINDKALNDKMNELKNNSIYSVISIINQLKIDYGIVFDSSDIKDLFSNVGNIGRPHVAKLLIKYGYVNGVQEAFDKYLADAYNKTSFSNKGISYIECINLIKNAGGISVLAHPNQLLLNDDDLEDKIKEMVSNGLDGIEVYHSGHSKEETKKYLEIANKYNLLISGGSDYHGKSVKPDINIGETSNGKIKRLSLLSKIK